MWELNQRGRDIGLWSLRQVSEAGGLMFECHRCRHVAEADVLALVGRFGPEALVSTLQHKAYCGRCGARAPLALVRLKAVRGDRGWLPHPPHARR